MAIIWVVDSADENRMQESKQELHRLLQEPDLSSASILVYLNKQDLKNGKNSQLCTIQ